MASVRPLEPDDIPRVIGLNRKLFPGNAHADAEDQARLFRSVCFETPWYDKEITSLVYEDDRGELSGFLGVLMRPMTFKGRHIRAAVFQHLMVDRSTLASLQLFRELLKGPQEISMGENAVDVVHRIWTRLGHPASRLNSIYWRRFLRPASLAAHHLGKRTSLRLAAAAALPFCRMIDAGCMRLPGNPLAIHCRNGVPDDELESAVMLAHLPSMHEPCLLTPVYTQDTLDWLLTLLGREHRNGTLQKKIVRTSEGKTAGWYLYYLNMTGPSVVFQIAGTERTIGLVLDHLFAHAWTHGALELIGRLEPRFMATLSAKRCVFMPGRNWMLVHSKHGEILEAINNGDAFLSRLEGDLWVL